MIILLGAMKEEIAALEGLTENPQKHEWKGFTYLTGKIEGHDVLVAKSGVGKVLSAVFTAHLIEAYSPKALIFSGLAGGLHPDLQIGDIVIAKDLVQHDLDATRFGFPRGQVPYTDFRFFASDSSLVALAGRFVASSGKVVEGRILTGDQFIAEAGGSRYDYLTKELSGWAVEMEGAAVAQVCVIHELPFLVCRIISDKADGKAKINFQEFLPKAAGVSADLIRFLLKNLK